MTSYLFPNNRIMKLRIALIAAAVLPIAIMGMRNAQADIAPSPSGSPMPVANFTVRCPFSHSANLDPIVMPGMVGMGHQHEFFGNTSTSENSTAQSLLAAPTTCAKVGEFTDANDHSAYWVPSLYQSGKRIAPTSVYASYTQLSGATGPVMPFQNGFKAVSGRSSQSVVWGCTSKETQSLFTKAIEDVPTCQSPQHLFARVSFANCWNGLSTDSLDHASHLELQYRVGGKMQCPSTHQIKVPMLTLNVQYPIALITNEGVSLASGPPSTMHADMFEAWTNDGLTKRISGT